MGKKLKRGKAGNAVQYVSRNQALKKLQVHLSDFRRLCILKGIHPREPKKKTQGQGKTYYHIKDINFLAHEPLLNKFRDAHAYEKKIRKAKAKKNADLAGRLASRRPGYKLDHLVRERYPSFLDAVRDLDDPLTMLHLFSSLPAEKAHAIPANAVHTSRRLALEWQSYVVRTHSLRKVFVSVKGFYYQAEVVGQSVTWLVPHQLSQVLPNDVDYRVMLTFLEFYQTLLKFVNFKLYHMIGAPYPPTADPKLQAAAAELASIMQDLAAYPRHQQQQSGPEEPTGNQSDDAGPTPAHPTLPSADDTTRSHSGAEAGKGVKQQDHGSEADSEDEEIDGDDDDDDDDASLPSISSGERGGSDDEVASSSDTSEEEGEEASHAQQRHADGTASSTPAAISTAAAAIDDPPLEAAGSRPEAAGSHAEADDLLDESQLCASIFRGLVFFLAREVPQEALLLVIRAFGGVAGWQGDGSPLQEQDESITHQVVDRPSQSHKFLSREYVQPQWLLDSANFRVMADARLYAPGIQPPPHLSPFVSPGDDDYVPDYARSLAQLQEAAKAARRRAQGKRLEQAFLEGADFAPPELAGNIREPTAEEAEQAYAQELAAELQVLPALAPSSNQIPQAAEAQAVVGQPVLEEEPGDEEAMKKALMPRKHRIAYESIQRSRKAKRARVAELEAKRDKLVQPAA